MILLFNIHFFELASCFWEMLWLSHTFVTNAITGSALSSNKYKKHIVTNTKNVYSGKIRTVVVAARTTVLLIK